MNKLIQLCESYKKHRIIIRSFIIYIVTKKKKERKSKRKSEKEKEND